MNLLPNRRGTLSILIVTGCSATTLLTHVVWLQPCETFFLVTAQIPCPWSKQSKTGYATPATARTPSVSSARETALARPLALEVSADPRAQFDLEDVTARKHALAQMLGEAGARKPLAEFQAARKTDLRPRPECEADDMKGVSFGCCAEKEKSCLTPTGTGVISTYTY
jgi:hypothetical protein